MQNLSQNEFNQIAEMRGLSRDELEQIAKIRRIKNYEDMKKEDLIISLLKSKESIFELFNDNNNNEISDIRRILNRLRDILPKKDRKEMKDKLYKAKTLNDKEEHDLYDRDDFDYFGIRDIENLFDDVSEENYCKPIFVKSSHEGKYKHYESNGDIEKKLSAYQYLNKIRPYLYDLINDHKIARRVWKIQINMHVNFISSKDTGETHIYCIWSNNVSIMQGIDTNDIIKELYESSLHDYQEKLKTIKGSSFAFESVDLMGYKLHRVGLKKNGSYIKSPKWLENKKSNNKSKK